jgi:hypothetical protein
MPLNYVVRAQVVDLRRDNPKAEDSFLVDSNVWFWTTYPRASLGATPPKFYQTRDYPNYLQKALATSAKLHWCGLALSELAHRIEKVEHEIWNATEQAAGRPTCAPKEFRHNFAAERARITREIETTWKAVESLGSVLPAALLIDAAGTTQALNEFKAVALDGYDLFLLQAARASGVTQIISDDGDFCCVAGITLFTSNYPVVCAARAQGKLLVR